MQKFIESLFKASDWWHKRAKGWVKFAIIAAAIALLLAIWSLLVEAFIYALLITIGILAVFSLVNFLVLCYKLHKRERGEPVKERPVQEDIKSALSRAADGDIDAVIDAIIPEKEK
jgi:amino acid transporter